MIIVLERQRCKTRNYVGNSPVAKDRVALPTFLAMVNAVSVPVDTFSSKLPVPLDTAPRHGWTSSFAIVEGVSSNDVCWLKSCRF